MSTIQDDQVIFSGAGAMAAMVRSREVHPRELVELCLRRIEALNPRLNAFRVVMAEQALAEAQEREGHEGLLAGVPIAVKDDLPVAGQSVSRGSRSMPAPEQTDSEVVRRLRAAGAIPIGITNVPELMIFPWTATAANGVTRNPWDTSRTPGGSSGGSAAAVAAGLVPVATGSDGGGSIRIPAACCGLVGLKPGRGRVPMAPLREGWLGLSVFGGLARTVADSALVMDAIHGALPSDLDPAPSFTGSYAEAAAREPGRLRIAVSRKVAPGLIARVSADQRGAWEQMATVLSGLGHEVVGRDPNYGTIQIEFLQTWLRGIYEESLLVPDRSQLETLTKEMAGAGRIFVPERRRDALRAKRARTIARILALWDEVDVLMTPGLATTAIRAEGGYGQHLPLAIDRAGRFTPFTAPFNVTGQPAISIPAGIGSDGLPLSVQLVGRPGAEDMLYSLAGQIETARPWADRKPALA